MLVGQPFTAVWIFDASAGAYVNNTVVAQRLGSSFTIMEESDDFLYLGFPRRHDALVYQLSTSGKYDSLTWEYLGASSTWHQFIPVQENPFALTPEYMLWDPHGASEEVPWVKAPFSNTFPHTSVTPPDTVSRFWIRVSAGTVTTPAVVEQLLCRPYVSYATATSVANQLQLQADFTESSRPSIFTVEEYIRGAEDELIYQMGESWRSEFIEEEFLNFNQYGMKLRYAPVNTLFNVAVWNGGDFDPKEIGRNRDVFVDDRTGMIYMATIFLDPGPPTFRRSYSSRRDQGSFKKPIRVRYAHGHDIRQHPLSTQLRRICTYKACADIVTNLDFSPLIPLGMDTIGLQTKYENWMKDYTEFVDKYAKLRLF